MWKNENICIWKPEKDNWWDFLLPFRSTVATSAWYARNSYIITFQNRKDKNINTYTAMQYEEEDF